MATITVLYTCAQCGIAKQPLVVPSRRSEDVKAWMDQTMQLVANDHCCRSPHCVAKTLTELAIPVAGTDKIGGPILN